jgi:hypothetical protein
MQLLTTRMRKATLPRRPSVKHNRVRLRLERLDERINPGAGDNVWISPFDGGFWDDNNNWSLSHPPDGDTLHFGNGQFGYGTNTDSYDNMAEAIAQEIDMAGYTAMLSIAGGDLRVEQDFIQHGELDIYPGSEIDVGNIFYLGGAVHMVDTDVQAGQVIQPQFGHWVVEGHTTVTTAIVQQAGLLEIRGVLEVFGNFVQEPTGVIIGGTLIVHGIATFKGARDSFKTAVTPYG